MILLVFFLPSFLLADFSGVPHPHRHGHGRAKRQMMSLGTKWRNGQVNYFFQNARNDYPKIALTAMTYISNQTCIRFNEDMNAAQRIAINLGARSGCDSPVGAPGSMSGMSGQLTVNVGNCPFVGNIVHELSHSLGSFHEHSRPDRDNYLTVDMAEANRKGQTRNMRAEMWGMTKMYVPFEYGSVMMYDTAKYGERIMTPRDPKFERTMGNRRIGFYDIQKINKYYGCACSKDLDCYNGGYTNPADCSRCVCPKGFFGKLCNERPAKGSFELAASSSWQSKSIPFTYTRNSDTYGYFSSTFAYINAPNNKTIEIELERMDNFVCYNGCNMNGVEIKTREDRRSVSPIVCCPDQEFAGQTFKSTNNPTIIEMYTQTDATTTVGFRYRYV